MQIETLAQLQQRLHREKRLLQLYTQAVSTTGICDFPALETFTKAYALQQTSPASQDPDQIGAESLPSATEQPRTKAASSEAEAVHPETPHPPAAQLCMPNLPIWVVSDSKDSNVRTIEAPSTSKETAIVEPSIVPVKPTVEAPEQQAEPSSKAVTTAIQLREVNLLRLFIQEVKTTGNCDYPQLRAFLATFNSAIAPRPPSCSWTLLLQSAEQQLAVIQTELAKLRDALDPEPECQFQQVCDSSSSLSTVNQQLNTLLNQMGISLDSLQLYRHPQEVRPMRQLYRQLWQQKQRLRRSRRGSNAQTLAKWETLADQAALLLNLFRKTLSSHEPGNN